MVLKQLIDYFHTYPLHAIYPVPLFLNSNNFILLSCYEDIECNSKILDNPVDSLDGAMIAHISYSLAVQA